MLKTLISIPYQFLLISRVNDDSTLIHVFYSDLKVFKYSTQQLYSSYDILGN